MEETGEAVYPCLFKGEPRSTAGRPGRPLPQVSGLRRHVGCDKTFGTAGHVRYVPVRCYQRS